MELITFVLRPTHASAPVSLLGYVFRRKEKRDSNLSKKDENGKCYSLRVAGLKGAGISIVVLIVSILACQGGYKFVHSQN